MKFAFAVWIRALTLLAALGLASCGGGGSDSAATSTINVKSTLASGVKVLSTSQLQQIVNESEGQITISGPNTFQIGDVLITERTALKITSISAPDQSGNIMLIGSVPDLSDVFAHLNIDARNYTPSPNQFIPADSSVVVKSSAQSPYLNATNPQQSKILEVLPRMLNAFTVSGDVTLSLTKQLTGALVGSLQLGWTPSIDYNVSADTLTGTITLNSPISVKLNAELSGTVGTYTQTIKLGKYSIPVAAPGLPPGVISLTVPVNLIVKVTAGKVSANFSLGGTEDLALTMNVTPYEISIQQTGNGFSWTADGTNILSFDMNVSSSIDIRAQTGVSLSAFFGLSTPLAGLVDAGGVARLTYAKIASSGSSNTPFDISCMSGTIDGVASLTARASLFGLSTTKAVADAKVNLLTYTPIPGCTTFSVVASPQTVPSPSTSVTYTVQLPSPGVLAGLFATPPTGTVSFHYLDSFGNDAGIPLCSNVQIDNTGKATCSSPLNYSGGNQATIQAVYSGDSTYQGGSGVATVNIVPNTITITPTTPTVTAGSTVQLTATETDSNGNTVTPSSSLVWSADPNNSNVTVGQSGLVSANSSAAGSANITVSDSSTGAIATATITVTQPLTCTLPQVLQSGVCVTPPPVCTPPQFLSGATCVSPPQVGDFTFDLGLISQPINSVGTPVVMPTFPLLRNGQVIPGGTFSNPWAITASGLPAGDCVWNVGQGYQPKSDPGCQYPPYASGWASRTLGTFSISVTVNQSGTTTPIELITHTYTQTVDPTGTWLTITLIQ